MASLVSSHVDSIIENHEGEPHILENGLYSVKPTQKSQKMKRFAKKECKKTNKIIDECFSKLKNQLTQQKRRLKMLMSKQILNNRYKFRVTQNMTNPSYSFFENCELFVRKHFEENFRQVSKVLTISIIELFTKFENVLMTGEDLDIKMYDMSNPLQPTQSAITCDSVQTTNSVPNVKPRFGNFVPISKQFSWAVMCNETGTIGYCLYLVTSNLEVLRELTLEKNICSLAVHPINYKLYGSFADNTIKTINSINGKGKTIVKCNFRPGRFYVTSTDEIIVSEEWTTKGHIFMFDQNGTQLKQSIKKFCSMDLTYNEFNNHVALACGNDGIYILNGKLTETLYCDTNLSCIAVFCDIFGNYVLGNRSQNQVIVLDGENFCHLYIVNLLDISGMITMRKYSNTLWIECEHPTRLALTTLEEKKDKNKSIY